MRASAKGAAAEKAPATASAIAERRPITVVDFICSPLNEYFYRKRHRSQEAKPDS
jgi:hypothetical protein